MLARVLMLILMVLLLALPHPGSLVVAELSVNPVGHSAGHDMPGSATQGPAHGRDHADCVALCNGSPLIETPVALAPQSLALALWAGAEGLLSRDLSAPEVPSRPPNALFPI